MFNLICSVTSFASASFNEKSLYLVKYLRFYIFVILVVECAIMREFESCRCLINNIYHLTQKNMNGC